jgi:HAD superfamily phosphatase (TIGR01668 family)
MKWLLPDLIVHSVRELTPTRLTSLGLRGVLLDVDGTLKPHYASHVEDDVRAWLGEISAAGIKLGLLTNGKARRLSPLAELLALPLFSGACKPLPFVCRRAIRSLQLSAAQTALVGDQLFTDVACGRLSGMTTVLVETLSQTEPLVTRIKRPFERILLRGLRKHAVAPSPTPAGAPC